MIFSFLSRFNKTSQTIASGAIIIGALSLVSRFLGIFRDRILASEFGAGSVLDVYFAAFRLPDFIYNILILGAVSAGLIPVFTGLIAKNKKKEAWELINNALNFLALILGVVGLLMFIFAPWIMRFITPGFNEAQMAQVVNLSRIMFLSPIFLGISSIFSSILQSFRRFFVYALAPIFYNLGIIIGALFFVPYLGLVGLAWGVVLGSFIHMMIQIGPSFATGFRYHFGFDLKSRNFREVIRLTGPRIITLVSSQINAFVVTIYASSLAAGSLAIFSFSNNLQSFPLGIFSISLAIASLPVLADLAAKKKMVDFVKTISYTIRQMLFFIVPASVLLYVLRAQVVRVILGSGSFDWQDTRLTAAFLAVFCLGLFAQGTIPILIRSFYALHNTKTPFIIGLISDLMNFLLLFLFVWVFSFSNWFSFSLTTFLRIDDLLGHLDLRALALPLALTVSSILNLTMLFLALRSKIGRIDAGKLIDSSIRILFSALGSGLIAYGVLRLLSYYLITESFLGLLAQGFLAGLSGLIAYAFFGWLLNMEELSIFISSFKKKLFRNSEVISEDGLGEGEI